MRLTVLRCSQCTRRGLQCEYPKESRRGQHKRGARAAKIAELAAAREQDAAGASSSTEGASTSAAAIKPKVSVSTEKAIGRGSPAAQHGHAPTSPLTPLPATPRLQPQHTPNANPNVTERKTRPEKVEIARRARSPRERSAGPSTARGKSAHPRGRSDAQGSGGSELAHAMGMGV